MDRIFVPQTEIIRLIHFSLSQILDFFHQNQLYKTAQTLNLTCKFSPSFPSHIYAKQKISQFFRFQKQMYIDKADYEQMQNKIKCLTEENKNYKLQTQKLQQKLVESSLSPNSRKKITRYPSQPKLSKQEQNAVIIQEIIKISEKNPKAFEPIVPNIPSQKSLTKKQQDLLKFVERMEKDENLSEGKAVEVAKEFDLKQSSILKDDESKVPAKKNPKPESKPEKNKKMETKKHKNDQKRDQQPTPKKNSGSKNTISNKKYSDKNQQPKKQKPDSKGNTRTDKIGDSPIRGPKPPSSKKIPKAPSSKGIPKAPSSKGIPKAPSSKGIPKAPSSKGIPKAPSSNAIKTGGNTKDKENNQKMGESSNQKHQSKKSTNKDGRPNIKPTTSGYFDNGNILSSLVNKSGESKLRKNANPPKS